MNRKSKKSKRIYKRKQDDGYELKRSHVDRKGEENEYDYEMKIG